MNAFNKYSLWKNVFLAEWTSWLWQYTQYGMTMLC